MNAKSIRLSYKIILSVALVIAAICLMVACVSIYRSGGEQIYTAEKIAAAFRGIALPVYAAVVLVIGGFLVDALLPQEKSKRKGEKNDTLILRNLHASRDLSGDPQLLAQVTRQQKLRKLGFAASLAVLAVGSAVFIVYLFTGVRFTMEDVTGSVIGAVWVLLPCMLVPAAAAIANAYFQKSSIRKEIALMKQAAAGEKKLQPRKQEHHGWLVAARIVLVCLAAGFVIYGYAAGGWVDVLTKAINICTECVGLG